MRHFGALRPRKAFSCDILGLRDPENSPVCLARHFNAGIPDLKACPSPGLNPVKGDMGAIPIPALKRRAKHIYRCTNPDV